MSTPYQRLQDLGISDVFIAAYLVLMDDRYPEEEAVKFLLTVEKLGKDPFDSAKHLVDLRRSMRSAKEKVKTK